VLLKATNLSKTYPGGIVAVRDFNCGLDKGFAGVIGPNAAGKTTLLKMLAGLEEPTGGKICVAGQELPGNTQALRSVLGYLPQEFGFYDYLTGEAMLEYIAVLKGVGDAKTRRRLVDEALAMVNLHFARKSSVGHYSFGMKRRLGIAQALLGKPRLLILDEPLEGLDPEESMQLGGLIAGMAAERLVIAATHSLGDVDGCTVIIVLCQGKTLYQGPPETLARFADGLIWLVEAHYRDLAELRKTFRVVGVEHHDGNVAVRVLAKWVPCGWKASAAKARLEEGYLALLAGGGE
jgi:ABC-2 type transport system ATP-binding protein